MSMVADFEDEIALHETGEIQAVGDAYKKAFKDALRSSGLPDTTLQDLRDSGRTTVIEASADGDNGWITLPPRLWEYMNAIFKDAEISIEYMLLMEEGGVMKIVLHNGSEWQDGEAVVSFDDPALDGDVLIPPPDFHTAVYVDKKLFFNGEKGIILTGTRPVSNSHFVGTEWEKEAIWHQIVLDPLTQNELSQLPSVLLGRENNKITHYMQEAHDARDMIDFI